MFKRVDYAQWADLVPYAAFFLIFAVFVGIVIWALRLSKKKVDYMAQLPLQEQPEKITKPNER